MASIERKESPSSERKDAELLDEIEEQNGGHVDRKAQYVASSQILAGFRDPQLIYFPPQYCCSRENFSRDSGNEPRGEARL